MLNRILLGLFIVGIGFIFVWKTQWPLNLIGRIPTAERLFFGGSRVFFKLVGLIIIFIGALVIANLHGGFIEATLGRLLVG